MKFDDLFSKSNEKTYHYTEELPYRFFDKDKDLFINKKTIGFGIKTVPLAGADDDIVESLNKLVCSFPEGRHWSYHFNLRCTNRVGEIITRNEIANAQGGGINKIFAENEAAYNRFAAKRGFHSMENAKFDIKDYELSIFVTTKPSNEEELMDLRSDISINFQMIGGATPINYTPEMLIEHVNTLLNFSHVATEKPEYKYKKLETINQQMLAQDSEYLTHRTNLEYQFTNIHQKKEKGRLVTYGLQELPKKFHLWRLCNCYADMMQPSRSITCPFEMNVSFKIGDEASESMKNDKRLSSLHKLSGTIAGNFVRGLDDEIEDREKLTSGLENKSTKVCELNFSITLFTTEEAMKKDKTAARLAFQKEGLRVTPNDILHNNVILGNLPFLAGEFHSDLKSMGLVRTLKTSNLVNFLPVTAEPSAKKEGLFLPTYGRTPYYLDLFTAGGDNYNAAIAGGSGAGKSVLTQGVVRNVISRNGVVWILDKGESYKKLTKLYGGQYLDSSNIRLNPFTHLDKIAKGKDFVDEEGETINPLKLAITGIVSLFMLLARGETAKQEEALILAIEKAYNKHHSQTLVDNVKEEIEVIANERNDREISDLAFQLSSYCTTGIRGEVFNEPSRLDPDVKLTTLELNGFSDDILEAVVYTLILNITQAMYLSGDRSTPKVALFEEAWKLMGGDSKRASDFITEGYRTVRKHLGSMISVVQSVGDYDTSPATKACYNNADVHILLKQGSGFKKYLAQNPDEFSPFEKNMLTNFKAVKRTGYSSVMLKISGVSSFHRYFLDPYSLALQSTEGAEMQYFENLQENGVPTQEAIDQTAWKFYGSRLEEFERLKDEVRKMQAEEHDLYEDEDIESYEDEKFEQEDMEAA